MKKTKVEIEKELSDLKSIKDIDRIERQLKNAGIEVDRDGWVENLTQDNCEWLDIKLPGKTKKKRIAMTIYFTHNATVLESIRVFEEKRIISYDTKELTLNGTEKRNNAKHSSH